MPQPQQQPLSRFAVIGALADAGWPQSRDGAAGFITDQLGTALFRVRYAQADPATAGRILAEMTPVLRGAGWSAAVTDGDPEEPRLDVMPPFPKSPGRRALEETDTSAYLAGRVVGLALHLASWYAARGRHAQCERLADKLARGGLPPTVSAIGQLSGLMWPDVRPVEVPLPYGRAFRDISLSWSAHRVYPAPPWNLQGQGEFVLAQHHQSAALTADIGDDQAPDDPEDCEDLTAENAAIEAGQLDG